MKIRIIAAALLFALTACGGGGGGGGGSASSPAAPATPSPPAVATINAADAFNKLMSTARTISDIPGANGNTGSATMIISPQQAYPFVTNGSSATVASSSSIQLQRLDSAGILLRQNIWRFDFDAQMNPVGMASGVELLKYTECMSVTSRTALPTALPSATNASGTFFSGNQTTAYEETFRAGTYAHYCEPTANYANNVEWSVLTDASIQYFCLTTPPNFSAGKTRMCVPVDANGALGTSVWLRFYGAEDIVLGEYRKK